MRRTPEYSAQPLDVGARPDGQAYATGTVVTRFGQRVMCVGRTVGAFVAVVEASPSDSTTTAAATSLCALRSRAPPDRRPESRIGPGFQLLNRRMTWLSRWSSTLYRDDANRGSALRVVRVERDPVAEVVQRDDEVGDRGALLLMHGPPTVPASAVDPEMSSSSSTDRSRRRRRLSR